MISTANEDGVIVVTAHRTFMKAFAKILSFVVAMFLTSSVRGNDLQDESIIVYGQLVYTNNYLPSHETKVLAFSFQRKGCDWLLKSGEKQSYLGYAETGFDGTNRYSFAYWNTDPVEKLRSDKSKEYFVTGQVLSESIPDFDAAWSRHIWFALMPYSCRSMTSINPCDLVTGNKIITNCNRVIFPTLDAIGLYVSNAAIWSQGNDIYSGGKIIPLAPPFDKGFTNLTFASDIVEWPNGIRAPKQFVYHVYGAIGESPTLLWSLYGTITNVMPEKQFNPLPEIIDPTYVIDSRATNYGNKQIIHYISTNKWLEPGDPEFQKLITVGDEEVIAEKHRAIARGVLIGFGVTGLFFIAFVWYKTKKY